MSFLLKITNFALGNWKRAPYALTRTISFVRNIALGNWKRAPYALTRTISFVRYIAQ